MSETDKIRFNTSDDVMVFNKFAEVSLQYFCDLSIQIYSRSYSPMIPYRLNTLDFSWWPIKQVMWVRGFVILQNNSYEFDELGEIFCSYGTGVLYYGWIIIDPQVKKPTSVTWKKIL